MPVLYEVNEFIDGDFKGLKFQTPVFDTLDSLVNSYGEECILSLVNQQIQARIRTKVKNSLPKNLKPDDTRQFMENTLSRHPDGIVFSEQQASEWKPDARELTANKLFKMAKEAFAVGDVVKGTEFLKQMGDKLQN